MDDAWNRIEAWLTANAAPIAAGLNPPAPDSEIRETEHLLGARFPDDVRASFLRHNGQAHDSPWMMNGWELLSLERIRDEWKVWKDLLDGGDFSGIQSDADGSTVRNDWWNPAWIPFTYSGSGDHYCLDLSPGPHGNVGQIIEMWHDEGARPVVAESFYTWMTSFADALGNDELVLSDEYGSLVRREDL
jgi:cell wall assembly regulator SMI1